MDLHCILGSMTEMMLNMAEYLEQVRQMILMI
jgi:hypothetical protein